MKYKSLGEILICATQHSIVTMAVQVLYISYKISSSILCNSCNVGKRTLPDMYALSPQACGHRALGIYIRQITCVHVTNDTYATPSQRVVIKLRVDLNCSNYMMQLIHKFWLWVAVMMFSVCFDFRNQMFCP